MKTAPNTAPKTAIVIGNGVVGLTCAIGFRQRGIATTILAPDQPWRGASWGNAGHIAIEQVEPPASPATLGRFHRRLFVRGGPVALPCGAVGSWLPFALRLIAASRPQRFAHGKAVLGGLLAQALPAWRRLLVAADAASLLREEGHIVVWESPRTAAAGLAHWRAADIGTARFEPLAPAELADLQRLTDVPLAGAIRFHGSAQIADTAALGDALHARFVALGGRIRAGRAVAVTGEDEARVMLDDGITLTADLALVAAGAASRALLASAGVAVPLIAERGYHIETSATDWPAAMPPMVFEDRSMIVTRFAGALRAASFVEFAAIDHPADPRKWARLRGHVASLGLSFGEPVRSWTGARPTLPDYLPAIGRLAGRPALAYAFGHQHLGLTLAAITGELVAAMAAGEPPAVDLAPFDVARFTGARARPWLR